MWETKWLERKKRATCDQSLTYKIQNLVFTHTWNVTWLCDLLLSNREWTESNNGYLNWAYVTQIWIQLRGRTQLLQFFWFVSRFGGGGQDWPKADLLTEENAISISYMSFFSSFPLFFFFPPPCSGNPHPTPSFTSWPAIGLTNGIPQLRA